jgi:hypothetical protein
MASNRNLGRERRRSVPTLIKTRVTFDDREGTLLHVFTWRRTKYVVVAFDYYVGPDGFQGEAHPKPTVLEYDQIAVLR